MGTTRLKKRTVTDRRREVAAMYLRGVRQNDIAAHFKISPQMVSIDLQKIQDMWVAECIVDFDARKQIELRKIDNLEEKAWSAWERSCEDAEVRTVKTERALRKVETEDASGDVDADSDGKSSSRKSRAKPKRKVGSPTPASASELAIIRETVDEKRKGQSGNPAFLERIAWCIEMRLKILGILKADKSSVNNNFMVIDWDKMVSKDEQDEGDAVNARIAEAMTFPAIVEDKVSSPENP